MSEEEKQVEAQLLTQLRILTSNLETVSDKADYLAENQISYADFVHSASYWPMDYRRLANLEDYRREITLTGKSAEAALDRISSIVYQTRGIMSNLKEVVDKLPGVQKRKENLERMKETKELDERELELKKAIVSKQSEIERTQKGMKRILGFSFVTIPVFTAVGILFPAVWVLCVTTIFVGIITLFLAFVMLSGLAKDGIIDTGKLEKDKVELDWVQTKKAQLFLESN
jgi:hypothetical protein|nr:MAG TPA: hypothetical protein [Caudoviricetes sp.]